MVREEEALRACALAFLAEGIQEVPSGEDRWDAFHWAWDVHWDRPDRQDQNQAGQPKVVEDPEGLDDPDDPDDPDDLDDPDEPVQVQDPSNREGVRCPCDHRQPCCA
jgi:hypothetical protein